MENTTEKILNEPPDLSRAILNSLRDHVAVLDARGAILAVNDAWERFAIENGVSDTERVSVGANYLAICRQAAKAGHAVAQEALTGLESVLNGTTDYFAMDYECSSPAQERWFTMTVLRQHQPGTGTVVTHSDITKRKQSEESLRASEERLRLLTDALPVLIAYVDANQRYHFNNKAYEIWFGYPREHVKGQHLSEVLGKEAYQAVRPHVEAALSGQLITFEDFIFYSGAGQRYVQVTYVPDRQEGSVRGFFTLVQDLTERKCSEEALNRAYKEIEILKERLEAENVYLREEINVEHGFENIIGQSDATKYVLYRVQQVAPTDATVFILGETGTGKGLVARAIHQASKRKDRPMVHVNCAVLPANLIESELFGREKGAFTGALTRQIGRFELADKGTIFLDEIGELPIELQAKLLKVIEEGEFERLGSPYPVKVDVRIIASTNRNLEEEIAKGRFRQDLFYRLNVFPITVPPLRQRREDIPAIVQYLVHKIGKGIGRQVTSVPRAVMNTLQDYRWPGNVRELQNVIERAVITSPGPALQLAEPLQPTDAEQTIGQAPHALGQMERSHILMSLAACGWKIEGPEGAAQALGLNPSTLRTRMKKLGIRRPAAS